MTSKAEETEQPFRDYYLALQVHPEADAGMIDAAYWHLARRYNEAALDDPSARAKLDSLNEAYSVLGSPARRATYNEIRNEVLGAGTLPSWPPPEPQPTPLAVMAKQRPKPTDDTTPQRPRRSRISFRQMSLPPWQGVVSAVIVLALASAALGVWASPGAVAALLAAGLVLTMVPLLRALPRLPAPSIRLPARPAIPSLKSGRRGAAKAGLTPEAVRRSREALQARLPKDPASARTPDGQPPPSTPAPQPSGTFNDKGSAA